MIKEILEKYLNIESNLIENTTKELLNHGWFISGQMEMKLISQIKKLVVNKKFEEADILIFNFYKKNLKFLINRIIKSNPDRKKIFEEALEAHISKNYYSSTILLLSQGDGIIDGKIFHNRKNLEKFLNERSPSFVKLLKEDSSLNTPSVKIKKEKYRSKMNRHSIMHGQSLDYNTEMNSLKALSLCCFVNDWYNRYSE